MRAEEEVRAEALCGQKCVTCREDWSGWGRGSWAGLRQDGNVRALNSGPGGGYPVGVQRLDCYLL